PDAQGEYVTWQEKPQVAQYLAVTEDAESDPESQGDAEEQRQSQQSEGGQAEARGNQVEDGPGEPEGENETGVAGVAGVAHGAGPAELVMQVAGKAPRGDESFDDFVGELDSKTCGVDAGAEFVVVGEIVGEGSEAADGIQSGAGDGQRGSEAEVKAAFDETRGEHARREVGGDAERFEFRSDGLMGAAAIKGCDKADGILAFDRREGCEDVGEVVGADANIAVADDEVVITGLGHKLGEVGDLAVRAEDVRGVDEADGVVRKLRLELVDDSGSGIVEARDAEENLVIAGVVLAAVAGKGFEHTGIEAMEWLENSDGGGESGRELRPAEKGTCAPEGDEEVAESGNGEQRGEAGDDGGEDHVF